jgi:hypothetical protein
VAIGNRTALHHADRVEIEVERPLRGDTGVELPQTTGGRVARVDVGLLATRGRVRIHLREPGERQENLAAYFEDRRRFATQASRHGADRRDIRGHVLAREAVATRGGAMKLTIAVHDGDREAVEFRFGGVIDRAFATQALTHLAVEIREIFFRESVLERQHRHRMLDLAELRGGRAGHALRRRILCDELRMRRLDRAQLLHEPVVFRVRNRGLVEHVIAVIVAVDLLAQPRRALGRRRRGHVSPAARTVAGASSDCRSRATRSGVSSSPC